MKFWKSYAVQLVGLVGGAIVSAVTFVITTVPKDVPTISWLWFAGALLFVVFATWRVFAKQAQQNQQEISRAFESAELVKKEWRDFRQHVETLNRENEMLNRQNELLVTELRRFIDLRPQPDVVLIYEGSAQFSALKLLNNGQADATKVSVSPATVGKRQIRFSDFARLRSRDQQTLDFIRLNLFPETILKRTEPEWSPGGLWRHALVWLFEDFNQRATVTVTFYDYDGKREHIKRFEIQMDSDWRVDVLPL